LQREHQPVDDRLALGLGLDGGEEARVGDGLGRLAREDFQKLHVARPEAAGAVRHVDEADQFALEHERHDQRRADLVARDELLVEAPVPAGLVREEGLAHAVGVGRVARVVDEVARALGAEREAVLADHLGRRVVAGGLGAHHALPPVVSREQAFLAADQFGDGVRQPPVNLRRVVQGREGARDFVEPFELAAAAAARLVEPRVGERDGDLRRDRAQKLRVVLGPLARVAVHVQFEQAAVHPAHDDRRGQDGAHVEPRVELD
jgi:hypothetical protein